MRVYDGESLKDTDPRAQACRNTATPPGVDEGMDGLSTRFAFKVLSAPSITTRPRSRPILCI